MTSTKKKTQYEVGEVYEIEAVEEVVYHYSIHSEIAKTESSFGNKNAFVGTFYEYDYNNANTEEYNRNTENCFVMTKTEPLSTFSIDVDAASYGNVRRMINLGQKPPKDAVRVEELINYFSYNYEKPATDEPVKITTELGVCPWNKNHKLVRIGIKAREIPSENLPPSNFVFLIDVSGSMYQPNRLPLVKSSLKLLINNLREKDRVAVVAYAGAAGLVLPSTSGADKQKILEAIDALQAGGSTAGGAGIELAYKVAQNNFIAEGNNRVVLCTDGDFNVGVSSQNELGSLIEQKRKLGIYLTILGYGMGNYKDSKLQTLSQKGNGNHAYIDNLQEANRVLVNEFGGTLYTVAKDVKLQIEFNPAKVQAYRLIGYESRLLNKEDFNDDTKDAGEIGAGQSVTAFYEVVPVGVESNFIGSVDTLKYQKNKEQTTDYTNSPDLLTVKLRYKHPDVDRS
jgi:Ca-activated chloride channel family protein